MKPVDATQSEVAAIVLAGGTSSRMGCDKALLPVNGMPLLRWVCQMAQECADPVYVVTGWGERYYEVIPEGCWVIQEGEAIPDWKPQGPLVGFAEGLTQVKTDWVLVLACDLPRLRADVLQAAIAQLPTVPSEAIACLPRQSNRWEPLCGFYRRSCLLELQGFIESGGRSFQRWLATQVVAELHLDDPSILFNCNTPADLARWADSHLN
ncbi:molybdenum cofactor guanylyltransferase [Oscillatoria sp. FACHB-1407]|uniref:molybdenum cofactor guanylyltransferase n=1 Tax=Oscillatoria sp. FACHB-1407 TaxID=2692847 RepID=UPI0016892AA7|nr:molybdenum cofactor guanylyltransferase [Oscillatoria sp. FACHB-1407]MBD2464978.1 molybdenum cofactor guanylyltransferase [Oscillatoria sp. FACHB-1407]